MAKNTYNCGLAYRDKVIGVMCKNGHCYNEDCKTCQDWKPDHWHNADGTKTARAIEQDKAWELKNRMVY
jgi:hypothetical protein